MHAGSDDRRGGALDQGEGMRRKKDKKRCHHCGHTDLKYGSSLLFKTEVTCVKCGTSWHEGREAKARKRYEKEIRGQG